MIQVIVTNAIQAARAKLVEPEASAAMPFITQLEESVEYSNKPVDVS